MASDVCATVLHRTNWKGWKGSTVIKGGLDKDSGPCSEAVNGPRDPFLDPIGMGRQRRIHLVLEELAETSKIAFHLNLVRRF